MFTVTSVKLDFFCLRVLFNSPQIAPLDILIKLIEESTSTQPLSSSTMASPKNADNTSAVRQMLSSETESVAVVSRLSKAEAATSELEMKPVM